MSKTIRTLASLFVLAAFAATSGCWVRERRDDDHHDHHEHEEVIVR